MEDAEPFSSTNRVVPGDALVVEFSIPSAVAAPGQYLENPQAERNSIYGRVETVVPERNTVQLQSDHTVEPVILDFDTDSILAAHSEVVIGTDLAVFEYDAVTTEDDPALESFK